MCSSVVRVNDASGGLDAHRRGTYAQALVLFKATLANGNEIEQVAAQTMIGSIHKND